MKDTIKNVAGYMSHHNIMSYYVGGCVRDEIMGIPTKDYDICLVGVTNPVEVERILLSQYDSVTPLVGEAFPVWKARSGKEEIDYAMARKETLIGDTRKDFAVITEGVTLIEDLRRRDFTMNAIAKNVLTGELIDPFGGIEDIKHNVLYHTSEAFGEDTLRVYRACRFLARFPEMSMSADLEQLCKSLKPKDISAERVGMEFTKLMEQAVKPSRFFRYLKNIGWLGYHFQEVCAIVGVPQDPRHHPEGDVFTHTMLALDEAEDPFIRVCMLCHDLGKATTTTIDGGYGANDWTQFGDMPRGDNDKIKSIGHEIAGMEPTRNMLNRIKYASKDTIRQVETMVELHMIRNGVSEKVVRRTLRKLMKRKLVYEQLVEVCTCDLCARPPLAKYIPDIGQYRASQLIMEDAMTPVVTGDMLIALGYKEGKELGHLVEKCLEWQDRGVLNKYNWERMLKGYKYEPTRKVNLDRPSEPVSTR